MSTCRLSGRLSPIGRVSGSISPVGRVSGSISPARERDYNALQNKPSIEGVELVGNKTFPQLGLDTATQAEVEAILYLP